MGTRSVLVVEDHVDVRATLVEVIRETGRPVYAAGSGAEALAMLERIPLPCLILLDTTIPGTTGRRLLQRIRQAVGPDQVAVVSMATSRLRFGKKPRGAQRFRSELLRPFDLVELKRVLDEHCPLDGSPRQSPTNM